MLVRIAGLVPESYVDGEGIRCAVFLQGCQRRCAGCHNPQTHDLNGGRLVDTADIIAEFNNPLLDGITLTGGEPLLQIEASNELARAAKGLGLNVWCYTGYTLETLPRGAAELLKNVDVLVDGAFDKNLRDLELPFRGSSNQRIIRLAEVQPMNNPFHHVKRYVYNTLRPYWYEDHVRGWLDTGIKDKDGKGIFEGDRVQFEGDTFTVTFHNAAFWMEHLPLSEFKDGELAVVGHIAEIEADSHVNA